MIRTHMRRKSETILQNHGFDRTKLAQIDYETDILLKRSRIQVGDIVFTIAGTLGRFALVDESIIPANSNQAVAIIILTSAKISQFLPVTCRISGRHATGRKENLTAREYRANPEKITPEYLYSFFIGNWHNEYYTKRIQQAVQANLSLSTIKSLPIAVLPSPFWERYLETITPIVLATKHIGAENQRLAAIRDTLLPKLMSGEIDVSDIYL